MRTSRPVRRPSPALVLALVALFSSLASGATAARLVSGKQIAKGTITGKNVKRKSLTGKHVKDGSLLAVDFKERQLPAGVQGPAGALGAEGPLGPEGARGAEGVAGADGATGSPGAVGPAGPKGDKGDEGDEGPVGSAGAPGATNAVSRHGSDTNIQASTTITVGVTCDSGERATGGGGSNGSAGGVHLVQSNPTPATQSATPTGWAVTYENTSGAPAVIRPWVICASP
ncbi:MAG: hypothetical protein QOJ22_493 [Thermoleophilaceae bacterium]|jgi:hypothetical protein|nr:hypothetical protein [Thermoleophilaceae bacterium]